MSKEMTMEERYQKGLNVIGTLWKGSKGMQAQPGDPENAKDLTRLVTEHCFSDSWSRPGLPLKTKSLLTIAILTTLGNPEELKGHIRGALNIGITKEEIIELLIHTLAYTGAPRTVTAFRVAKEVFSDVK